MVLQPIAASARGFRWLRGPEFDLAFIIGIPALALLTGAVVVISPELFWPILLIDLWFLGYHHVIATYTRLCFDKASLESSKFLIFGLMPLVALATIVIAVAAGLWAVVTIYFYWQWFHYTRQSWGVSRAYRGKEPDALYEDGWSDQAIFYALPVIGILYRSYQRPGKFLAMELVTLPVPQGLMLTVGRSVRCYSPIGSFGVSLPSCTIACPQCTRSTC